MHFSQLIAFIRKQRLKKLHFGCDNKIRIPVFCGLINLKLVSLICIFIIFDRICGLVAQYMSHCPPVFVFVIKYNTQLLRSLCDNTVIRDNIDDMLFFRFQSLYQGTFCTAQSFPAAGRHAHEVNVSIFMNILKSLFLNFRSRKLQACLILLFSKLIKLVIQFLKADLKIRFQRCPLYTFTKAFRVKGICINQAGIAIPYHKRNFIVKNASQFFLIRIFCWIKSVHQISG